MKDIALHILDIVQNSIAANALAINILLEFNKAPDHLAITISDNGRGIDSETLKKVTDPFYTERTTRKVGLGLPLLKQNAEQTGGWMKINSLPNHGTCIEACFMTNHWDCPPLGDLAGVLVLLVQASPQIHFIFETNSDSDRYRFDTDEIKQILEEVPINSPEIREGLKLLISSNIGSLINKFR